MFVDLRALCMELARVKIRMEDRKDKKSSVVRRTSRNKRHKASMVFCPERQRPEIRRSQATRRLRCSAFAKQFQPVPSTRVAELFAELGTQQQRRQQANLCFEYMQLNMTYICKFCNEQGP